jgi:DNA-binding beta-propeller fold protein YncE
VAHPQIAVFARLANGGQAPVRSIYGQISKLSRTMHDIRYDEVHDEIVVPVPYGQAILTFRGGASGQEGPIRILQGPKVGTIGSRVDVDPINNEIYVPTSTSIRVFPRDVNGDAAPIRVIEGPDTQLKSAQSVAVDPINNIIAVGLNSNFGSERAGRANRLGEAGERQPTGGILIFSRTANGNAKPIGVIRGPNSGIIRINQIQVYPQRKLIVAAQPGIIDQMEPAGAFLGVWSQSDNGDVPPLWKLPVGERTKLKKPFGVVLNPKNKEVIVSDMRNQGILMFSVPEIF